MNKYNLEEYCPETGAWDCPNCGKVQGEYEVNHSFQCVSCGALIHHDIWLDDGIFYRLVPTQKDIEYMKSMPHKYKEYDILLAHAIWQVALLNQDNFNN